MEEASFDVNQIAAETIADLAKSAAAAVWKKGKKAAQDAIARSSVDFGLAFRDYLNNAKERCEQIKTLLYRQPQSLYSFYVSLNLRLGAQTLDTRRVASILTQGHKLLVTGTGGIGKTMMLKYFFVDCVKHTGHIPVLVELRGLNDQPAGQISLERCIYENLRLYHFGLAEEYFRYSLEAGCYLFLFDGFDEVKSPLANKVAQEIQDLATRYKDNYFVVSSRPSDVFRGWQDFAELEAMPMTKAQALELVSRLDYDADVKDKFYRALDEGLFKQYESFASNPLLLTIMLLTFDYNAALPDRLNDFYEQAFSALFNRHDAMKGHFQRDIASKLSYESFKAVFSYFCFKTYFKMMYEFSQAEVVEYIGLARKKITPSASFTGEAYLHDLTDGVCMLLRDGLNYRFSHRSFQEYFAALYTTQLDDDTQKHLLTAWLREMPPFGTFQSSVYLSMLYDLQRDRFIKNALLPGLIELRQAYEARGRDPAALLELTCDGFALLPSLQNEASGRRLGLVIDVDSCADYYSSLIQIGASILELPVADPSPSYTALQEEVAAQLMEEFNWVPYDDHSLSELREQSPALFRKAVEAIHFEIERVEAVFQLIDQYRDTNRDRGRSIDALLEDL